jgi:hypothetical protein
MSRNRRADWRRIKSKYSYTTEEAARALNLHRNTVRNWIRRGGLPAMTESRPHLILGGVLVEFLKAKRLALKRKCGLGELYCLKCHRAASPAFSARVFPLAGGATGLPEPSTVFRRGLFSAIRKGHALGKGDQSPAGADPGTD